MIPTQEKRSKTGCDHWVAIIEFLWPGPAFETALYLVGNSRAEVDTDNMQNEHVPQFEEPWKPARKGRDQ